MTRQSIHRLFMIRPATVRMNEETSDNRFQKGGSLPEGELLNVVQSEFDAFVELLRSHGIGVHVASAEADADTPDAHFPNNWISFHEDGRVALYPMRAANRRRERREDLVFDVCNTFGLEVTEIVDFTEFEDHDSFLEGTGSMVLDRVTNVCYAALSERTDSRAVEIWCDTFGYRAVCFETSSGGGSVYHTNVVMCIGSEFVVACTDVVQDPSDRQVVTQSITESGRELIKISEEQLVNFAGNMLEVLNEEGRTYLVMSSTAHAALTEDQRRKLEKYGTLLVADLPMIERYGGGSARCMLCEVFLPKL